MSNAVAAVGIICEYNPFHNGHALQLRLAKKFSGVGFAICIMSGPFVQRGDIAIADKWTRAKAALLHGADLVLELPVAAALRAAPDFAKGAVGLLARLGCVNAISFGSELPLEALAQALKETDLQSAAIQSALRRGESYPRAVSAAGQGALFRPNATLGVEYMRQMERYGIRPIPVHRASEHDSDQIHPTASASAIREAISKDVWPAEALPAESSALLKEALAAQGGPPRMDRLFPLLLLTLRRLGTGALDALPGSGEGLGNRLLAAAKTARSLEELYAAVKCKRYTLARIRRLAAMSLLLPSEQELSLSPTYARVLGFRREALPLLRQIDRRGEIPLTTKLPKENLPEGLALDLRAQELWALSCPIPAKAGMDYTQPMIVV